MDLRRMAAIYLILLAPIVVAASMPKAVITGTIDDSWLPEASGIAASQIDGKRLYHINDSGNAAEIICTDLKGASVKKIVLEDVMTEDTEDLAVGLCPDRGSCLYIADIGDNSAQRESVSLKVVREPMTIPSRLSADFVLDLNYPDGRSHNAESLAIHPKGYGFVLSKEQPSTLYRFKIPQMRVGEEASITLEALGRLDLSSFLKGEKSKQILPTSMTISADGKQLVILTRAGAVHWSWDLLEEGRGQPWGEELDLNQWLSEKRIEAKRLPFLQVPQAEAITFVEDGKSLIYSTESDKSLNHQIPLVKVQTAL